MIKLIQKIYNNTNNSKSMICSPQSFSISGTHKCFVYRIYDGDTIHINIPIITKIYDYKIENNIMNPIVYNNKIDPNDIKIYSISIRLYGIDTPELKPKLNIQNRDNIIENAIIAKKYLENIILNKNIFITFTGLDKYGRHLGILYEYDIYLLLKHTNQLDKDNYNMSINKKMISGGYAVEYFGKQKNN